MSVLAVERAPASVGAVRRRLRASLRDGGVPVGVSQDAELVLSELLSNAVNHGSGLPGGMVHVSWEVTGDVVRLSVRDGGASTTPTPRRSPSSAEGGRGLAIVEVVSTRWGTSVVEGGLLVWAELRFALSR